MQEEGLVTVVDGRLGRVEPAAAVKPPLADSEAAPHLPPPEDWVCHSQAMREVWNQALRVAPTDSVVLLTGETGTGKELVADAIHRASRRRNRPMIRVNCAALPPTLIESELFGREKGAYTGALSMQVGRFELADRSTLFLDEIGELPIDLQAKLLRVLQLGEFERLGSAQTRRVDVRVIAATNRDLARASREGSFRLDLLYRLNVFPIHVPPLRARAEDLRTLVWVLVQELGAKMGKRISSISACVFERLERHSWPGNVRELRNVLERAMILTSEKALEPRHFDLGVDLDDTAELTMASAERRHIQHVLARTRWRVRGRGGAAELLDLNEATLRSRMRKLGIRRPV
jgi:transcriptional regulator with GAF, ATPase, and Fis domain